MFIKIPFKKKKISVEMWEFVAFFKLLLRRVTYNVIFRKLITFLIYSYLYFVYKTSQKKFYGFENIDHLIADNKPMILAFWHNRLMMIPFIARRIKNKHNKHNLMTLASRHGDGRIVGMVMEWFGLISILGSTKDKNKNKANRGIDYKSLRMIIDGLKNGNALGITPDGPRGPNQNINGDLLNIARITGATIVVISYSSSRFKIIKKSWDKFKVPLPFAKISFVIDDNKFEVKRDVTKNDLVEIKKQLKKQLNRCQKIADDYVKI